MGKLNLFRKGRGKEYRQTKRAIKKQIKKTGGFTATAGAEGKFTITGGSGATGGSQSGSMRRKTARGAAEHMTAGIDNATPFGGSDSQTWTGGVSSRSKRSTDWTANKGAGSWRGTGTKAGVTTNVESKVDVTGPSVENVQGQITELEKDNPKISMKSSAFKMKYSPFNQGYGSPLNWNERSPLNNLNKGDELVQSKDGAYMKESSALPCNDCGDSSPLHQSSPLNEKTCPPPGKPESTVLKDGKCWKPGEVTTTTEVKDVDGVKETTDTTQTALERGKKGKKGKKAKNIPNTAFEKACLNEDGSRKAEGTKSGGFTCSWEKDTPDTPDTTEQDKLETKKVKAEGTAKVITSVTDCPDGGKEYKLVDGKCIKKAAGGVNDESKARTKKCRCKGEVTEIPRSQDCPKCEKDPKVKKEKKEKDKTCKGNKVWSEEKGRCVGVKKEKTDDTGEGKKRGMKKVCKEWEYVSRGK